MHSNIWLINFNTNITIISVNFFSKLFCFLFYAERLEDNNLRFVHPTMICIFYGTLQIIFENVNSLKKKTWYTNSVLWKNRYCFDWYYMTYSKYFMHLLSNLNYNSINFFANTCIFRQFCILRQHLFSKPDTSCQNNRYSFVLFLCYAWGTNTSTSITAQNTPHL